MTKPDIHSQAAVQEIYGKAAQPSNSGFSHVGAHSGFAQLFHT